jgi:hypothetical protein
MKDLTANWLTEPSIDFEYKKYVLLAYLQGIERNFVQNKLYPFYQDLQLHHHALSLLSTQQRTLQSLFPKHLEAIDLNGLQLHYSDLFENSALMDELGSIVSYALPQLEQAIGEGQLIRNTLLEQMELTPIGIVPLYLREGYLLLDKHTATTVYEYRLSLIQHPQTDVGISSISTRFVTSYPTGMSHTFDYIKNDLIRTHNHLPNPATYALQTDLQVPEQETLLPLAKQILYQYIAA